MSKADDTKFFYGWLVLLGCFLISFNYGFFYPKLCVKYLNHCKNDSKTKLYA